MKNIISKIIATLAIIISLPLVVITLVYTQAKNNNFQNKTLIPLLQNQIITNGPEWILKSQQYKSFPETIINNISQEEIRDILNENIKAENIKDIIKNLQDQLKNETTYQNTLATIEIPINFLTENPQLSKQISEAVINDIPDCDENSIFSSNEINCKPASIIGNDTSDIIASLIQERYLNRLPKNISITIETGENSNIPEVISTIEKLEDISKTGIIILLTSYILLIGISSALREENINRVKNANNILFQSAIINGFIYIPTYFTFRNFDLTSTPQSILISSILSIIAPLISVIIAILIATISFKIFVHFKSKPEIESP